MSDELNHEEALQLAELKHASNLAKCYLDLHRRFESLQSRFYAINDQLTEARALITMLQQERAS